MIHPKHLVSVYDFADDMCIYVTGRKEGYILRNLQWGLSTIKTWCDSWNIKINEDKTQAIYFLIDLCPLKVTYIEWTEYPLCHSWKNILV
jgi:hypothetical protein